MYEYKSIAELDTLIVVAKYSTPKKEGEFYQSETNLEVQLKEREKQYEYYRNKLLTFE